MTSSAFTDSANRLSYTADSSTVAYSFNFEIIDGNSIAVFVDGVQKTISTDFSVTFDSGTNGTGSVVFTSAPAANASIVIKRDTDIVRTTDFQTSGSFTASAINTELDRLTQSLQEVDDKISNRVLRVDDWQTTPSDFTIPSTRANQYLKFDSSGNIAVSDSFVGNTITTTGNVSVGGTLSVTGALTLASLTVSGNIGGTLTTAAQPNITSVGTLTSLTVDNLTLNDNQIASSTGTIALDDTVTVNGNITASGNLTASGDLSATNIAGTLTTAAQTNITSIGTLGTLTVTGLSTLDGITINDNDISATRTNDNLNLSASGTGQVVVNGNLSATNIAGTLTTAAQANITSLGTLTALTVDNLNLNSNVIASDNGTIALDDNVTVNGDITATNIAGTLTTAAQANITSVGTLTALQVDNINVNGNTISATTGNLTLSNITALTVDNISIDGNTISSDNVNGNIVLNPNGSGTVDVSTSRIVNVTDPTDNNDAANKGWVITTLSNAGISVGGGASYQSKIENGTSKVEIVATDGDTHIVNDSSTLYKFEAAEFESAKPIRLTGDFAMFANKNNLDTTTITTESGHNYVLFGAITINSGQTVTVSNGSEFRVI
jgi:hypothetical protein